MRHPFLRIVVPRAAGVAALLLAGGCAGGPAAPPAAGPDAVRLVTSERFCVDAQAQVAATRVPTVNVLHADYDAFVESKPQVRPLQTQQYVWYEDGAKTRPKMISCKMKTSDHIRSEYGADQSDGDTSCAALNERTAQAVLASLGRAERRRLQFDGGRHVVYDEDSVTTDGPTWLAPFPMLSVGTDGALHVKSKGMKNDWLDPRLAKAAPRFKGTRYCHLVAPEYFRRVLLGEVRP
ncbi:MAG: hypothetical protein MUF07_08265 [Steroidobacteraceae bacterium]|jgi:hypothetical protein|nr:hypothetical protein [Steroidobacteraceae bacterium]